ncbi:hypothetical protein G7Y89_g11230 [Cudoniella acicularis]|uniref:Glucose-methanol-choline oxidoreductase N-terminal domain-containing protein n=1 Tax=Cudoniella acicularis TaxID=354080 RepID=A0A8H4W0A9_9HELO|nr:hypothetical protein G7Y89_g11230 [Cudoniella acicularis]
MPPNTGAASTIQVLTLSACSNVYSLISYTTGGSLTCRSEEPGSSGDFDLAYTRWDGKFRCFRILIKSPCECLICNQQFRTKFYQRRWVFGYEKAFSDDEARGEAANLTKTLRDNLEYLRKQYETNGNIILKRWKKKSGEKRKALLLEVDPDIYPDQWSNVHFRKEFVPTERAIALSGFNWPDKDATQGRARRHYRNIYLLPYINPESLKDDPARLLNILYNRAKYPPEQKEEIARLDEILYNSFSDLSALQQLRFMLRLHQPRTSVRELKNAQKFEVGKAWRYMRADYLNQDHRIPDHKINTEDPNQKLKAQSELGRLMGEFLATPKPTGSRASQKWLDQDQAQRAASEDLKVVSADLAPEYLESVEAERAEILAQIAAKESQNTTKKSPELKVKVKTRSDKPMEESGLGVDSLTISNKPEKQDIRVAVSKRALETLQSLYPKSNFEERTKSVDWASFVHAMAEVGFIARQIHGSEYSFEPSPTCEWYGNGKIVFHKPHPEPKYEAWKLLAAQSPPKQRLFSSGFAIPGNASYDYVVVGGGTAGLAIASRLAETASVAVIEAGGLYEIENGNQSVVPWYALTMGVLSISETYPRQPLVDWDLRWADLVDDQSYTFPNLLPYFKKSCQLTPPNLQKRNVQNATVLYDPTVFDNSLGGPVQVSWGNWVDITSTWLALAMQSIGLALSPLGLSSGVLSGYGAWVTSEIKPDDATRSSSQASYLRQSIESTMINVYVHTQATRILFDQESPKRATAVSVSTQGFEYAISANKEIILSAGVFHSPQLLMVSGIGPRATLESYNIPVISDLPGVGQNLWDQIFFDVNSGVNTPNTAALVSDPSQSAQILKEYLDDASGPYSSTGGFIAFEKVPEEFRGNFSQRTSSLLATLPSDWPEIEYIVLAFPNVPGANATTVGAVSATIQAPFSRGNVTLSSASMSDPPIINLGWLTDPADGELLVAAFKRCRQAWSSDAIKDIKVGPEIAPGETVQTDADILAWIRQNVAPVWHASSTCAMGKEGDPAAVVDSNARVFGVQGLRVVDNSAIPFSIPGHPSGSVYMFAEKIADDVKNGS